MAQLPKFGFVKSCTKKGDDRSLSHPPLNPPLGSNNHNQMLKEKKKKSKKTFDLKKTVILSFSL